MEHGIYVGDEIDYCITDKGCCLFLMF